MLARANPLGTLLAFRGHKRVLGLTLVAFIWQLAFHVYPSTWAYFVIAKFGFTPAAIGGTLALSGLSMAIVQGFFTGRIVAAWGEARVAPIGIAVGIGRIWLAVEVAVFGLLVLLSVGWIETRLPGREPDSGQQRNQDP